MPRRRFPPVPVTIRGVTYPSQSAAAEALGLHPSLISRAYRRGTLDQVGAGYVGKSFTPLVPPIAADLTTA
jgi:hypothetical protein